MFYKNIHFEQNRQRKIRKLQQRERQKQKLQIKKRAYVQQTAGVSWEQQQGVRNVLKRQRQVGLSQA